MAAKTSEQAHADTSLLSRRIFSSPRPRRMIAPIAGVSLLSAVFLTLPPFTFESLGRNLIVLVAPIYGSAGLTLLVARALGGRTYLRRTTLQAFVDALTVFGFIAVVALTEGVSIVVNGAPFDYSRTDLLYLGFASTAWLRHSVWIATSDHRHGRTLPASAMTPVLGFVAVKLAYTTTPLEDALFLGMFAAFLTAGLAFTVAANQPIRHAFGANGLKLLRHLLDSMTDMSEDSRRELESFFESFAQPAEVRIGALAFRTPHGTAAVVVVPHAHPGPFGRVSGSDLPAKLRTAMSDVSPAVLVPHGPSTHDHNPSTSAECGKIAAAARGIASTAKPLAGGSRFARATVGRATATAQLFGDVALVTASLAPNPTDDIDAATGLAAVRAAKDAGARDALFVDAHNCMEIASGMVHFGSEESLAVIEATHAAVLLARERLAASLRVGVAEAPIGGVREGIGAQGLQVLAVESDGQRAAYLLFDGNNMVPGLRDEILAAVREIVDEAEVLTTDNHSVNATMGGYNPVGLHMDRGRIVAASRELVARAVAGLRPVESAAGSDTIHGLRVFGHESTARLTTSINATASILRPTAVLTFGLALALALALLAVAP